MQCSKNITSIQAQDAMSMLWDGFDSFCPEREVQYAAIIRQVESLKVGKHFQKKYISGSLKQLFKTLTFAN